jgi:Asp-tRNA(Asn)/Glu-tRNA(Gln) amidotransferase A subunit family amidase
VCAYMHSEGSYVMHTDSTIISLSVIYCFIVAYGLKQFKKVYETVDVIISPTIPITAPAIDDSLRFGESNMETTTAIMRHMFIGNLLGLPALTVPIGYDQKHLPIGLQIMGPHWSEALLLQVGREVERAAPAKAKPERYYKVL